MLQKEKEMLLGQDESIMQTAPGQTRDQALGTESIRSSPARWCHNHRRI
jgi:hypothetical protein